MKKHKSKLTEETFIEKISANVLYSLVEDGNFDNMNKAILDKAIEKEWLFLHNEIEYFYDFIFETWNNYRLTFFNYIHKTVYSKINEVLFPDSKKFVSILLYGNKYHNMTHYFDRTLSYIISADFAKRLGIEPCKICMAN